VKKLCGIFLVVTAACAFGCAGPGSNTVAGNVATGATINALGGVPGAGIVGLAASAIEIFSGFGHPTIGKASPKIIKYLNESPTCNLIDENGKLKGGWASRKLKDGRVITKENASQRAMDYSEAYMIAVSQFVDKQFGDTEEMRQRNLKAWEEGTIVIAEYHGPKDTDIVIVSTNREPAEAMLAEEWAARKTAGDSDKNGGAQEPVNTPVDQKDTQPSNAKN